MSAMFSGVWSSSWYPLLLLGFWTWGQLLAGQRSLAATFLFLFLLFFFSVTLSIHMLCVFFLFSEILEESRM